MTIPADALPAPSNYARRKASGVFEPRNDLRRMHYTDQPQQADHQVSVILLTWQNVRPEVVDAIMAHYDAYGVGTWLWSQPALEDVPADGLHVRWLSEPNVNTSTPISASVTGELEHVLAFTPPT